MTYEINCQVCGKHAVKKSPNAKYCSKKCGRKSYEIRTGRKRPGFIKDKISEKPTGKGKKVIKRRTPTLPIDQNVPLPVAEINQQIEATKSNLSAWKLYKQEQLRKFEKVSKELPGQAYVNWATAAGAGYGLSQSKNEDDTSQMLMKAGGGALAFNLLTRGAINIFFKNEIERKHAAKLEKIRQDIVFATSQINAFEINIIAQKRERAALLQSAPVVNKTSSTIKTAESYRKEVIETLGFKGAYQYLIGDPAANFYVVLTGAPGNGKSTFAVQFANYFQANHGKVLLMAAEQRGMNKPLQQLLRKFDAKFDIETEPHKWNTEKWIEAAKAYQLIIVDSATNLDLAPEQIENIRANAPKTAFLVILQSTKDGKYKGNTQWKHNCDIFLKAEEMKIYQTKSRYSKPAHIVLDEF